MSKEHLVPIAEVQTQRINARNLHLPPYLNGKIGIDLEKTARLMNIGGISHVLLASKEEDERPVPQVVGFDAQGTAYSGYAKLKTQSVSEAVHNLRPADSKGQEWRDVRIALDTQLIAQNITHKRGGVASVNNWVKPLNREIRNTIRREAMSFSLKPSRFAIDYASDSMGFVLGGAGISFALLQEYGASAIFAVFMLIDQREKLGKMLADPGYRADAFYSIHIGRAFWTAFRANTAYRNLVVAMEK